MSLRDSTLNEVDQAAESIDACLDLVYESSSKKNIADERKDMAGDLNMLLAKMDKFGHCDKFLDKEGFCSEYSKEINKKGKCKTKK